MRKAVAVVVALLLISGSACLVGAAGWYLRPAPGPEPVRYSVVRGDTLAQIAKAQGVTVGQIREWNGIEGDLIEVGQVLVLYTSEPAAVSAAPARKKKRRKAAGGTVTAEPGAAELSDLVMPAAQSCLAGPTDVAADEGFAAAEGLSDAQVRSAMSGFVHHTLRCFPPGTPSGRIHSAITVGCDGRVSAVDIEDDGGLSADVVGCVRETLAYATFPSHDMPDGYGFEYPLRFEAP